jgi:hypothetical protein
MTDLKVEIKIEFEINYFDRSGIFCHSDVFVNFELPNQIKRSNYYSARFPLCVNEKKRKLYDVPFTVEMFHYDYKRCKEKRIACCDSIVNVYLSPSPPMFCYSSRRLRSVSSRLCSSRRSLSPD